MDPNLLAFGKTLAGQIVGFVIKPVKDALARRRASERAIQGEDLAGQGSLEYLVKTELEKLASSDKLPLELQSQEFRNWLLQGDNVELFVQVFIARAGNQGGLAEQAEEKLAAEYERITGETRKRTAGPLALAVSHVYGQLQATEAGNRALQTALTMWSSAQLYRLTHPELRAFPADADLERVRATALILLEAGKSNWKMPRFVAPLNLEAQEEQEDNEPRPTNAAELADVIEAGGSLVLFGEGGIGKTTFLLDLCSSCMNGEKRRIPLYIDAAVWARSNTNPLDYIASNPSAQLHGVTSAELARLAEAGYLAVMVNGWNEIPASQKVVCQDAFSQLIAAAGSLSVVVVSRTSNDTASLPTAKRVKVQGLTWQGQSAVIRAELGNELAAPLLALLAKDTRLRRAARSPLILRGFTANAKKGAVEASSVYDLLGAVVQAFEEGDQRTPVLNDAPVYGLQRYYLEELACQLSSRLTISFSREEALPAITSASRKLEERGLSGPPPHSASVLDVLVSHHLLHFEDGAVRFAHQRFQEYFAATRLLRECVERTDPSALLFSAVNMPAWDDSLMLVAGKLKGMANAAARAHLVKAAARLDLGFSCDLAGLCVLSEADDPELHHHLVVRVNELIASPLEEVRDLGVAYQIASDFSAFAEKLWPLLEGKSQSTRLHAYRLNGSGISLAQLGSGAEERVAAWPSERRIEFLHELAGNADNYDFLVRIAHAEPDHAVRAAAISALFWNFPASDAPIQAWLNASVEVQTEHNVVSYIEYALDEGLAGEEVRERLRAIAVNDTSENVQLRLALAFPNEVGPLVLDVVFAHLRSIERHGSDAPLVAIAQANAPERLLSLAKDLVLGTRAVPDWASTFLRGAPAEVRADVFERSWAILQSAEFKNLDPRALGPLADRSQTQRSVAVWLQQCIDRREKLTDVDRDRGRQLGYLLAHAPGNDLLSVVMERGQAASYNEAAELIELVRIRIDRDDEGARTVDPWLPTTDEVRQLISRFSEKSETAEIRQDKVFVFLSCIASHVAPHEFGSLLLDTCRRHLDAWTAFRDAINQWAKRPASQRPHNPSLGNYVIAALAKWGPDALPGLMVLMTHPSAMELIPEAIGRIVSLPWDSKKNGFFSSVGSDASEGEQRRQAGRVLRQPEDIYQGTTDEAARTLGQKLTELIERLLQEKSTAENWNSKQAAYGIRRLISIVAHMPSPEIELPVNRALASGLVEVYGFVGALRGLVRQGLLISDAAVVGQLEALYEHEASAKWLDDSARYAMAELSELMYCVEPPELLTEPLSHYLAQWQRFAHTREAIRQLGALRSRAAWPSLVALGKELAPKGPPPEELAFALASALTPAHFAQFIELVADGTLFSWCRSIWNLERIAPNVASVIGEDLGRLEALLNACRQSSSPPTDTLASSVLAHVKGSDATRLRLGLDAVDAGRAVDSNMPSYRTLLDMFKLQIPMSYEGQYEVHPRSCNELRAQLYLRAKGNGPIAVGCRRLLASIECQRREDGRPTNEARHPDPNDGVAWTDALAARQEASVGLLTNICLA